MMSPSNPRPKWWQLYLTFPLLIALFALDGRLKISARGHQAVQIGIILLVYGLIHLWLKANKRALSQMDRTQHSRTIRIVRVPAAESPEAHREKSTLLQLPEGEIRGLLTNTMDMNYIDAESSTLDDVRRN